MLKKEVALVQIQVLIRSSDPAPEGGRVNRIPGVPVIKYLVSYSLP